MKAKPNILLFLTDDHGPWTLSDYGNRELPTPHLSRLAREGTLFRNAFTPSPVCSPARACLMTGRTPSQVGIHDWLEEADAAIANRPWLADEITLPELLRDANYHTILSGKWHLGGSHDRPQGFDRCFGFGGTQGLHHGVFTYQQDGMPIELNGNKSAHITDRAIAMLQDAPADRPFFLNVGYIATHSPFGSWAHDPQLIEEVKNLSFRDIPARSPHPWHRYEQANEGDALSCYRGYYAAVLEIDRNVGRILKHLDESGQMDDTIVVYVSDHGCALGHQGIWGKGNSTRPLNMYDVSLRIPLLMRGPGIARGQGVETPVDHYDLFEALCEWGGANRSPDDRLHRAYPGTSLAPLARGETLPDWQQERYGEYGDLRMIRTPEFKLVKRYGGGPDELFDLSEDPDESHNLAGLASHASLQRELERDLDAWYARHEDPVKSGLRVKSLPVHNLTQEAWRGGSP